MSNFIASTAELPIDSNYEIIAETDEFLLINKSGNIPVHEGGRYQENSLTKVIEKQHCKVTPVFRLDRETSGLILFAKKNEYVKKLFDNTGDKEYVAVVQGIIDQQITIDEPIGECKGEHVTWKKCVSLDGKSAVTQVYPINSFDGKTLVKLILKTGRQHQIRVHLSHIGHPVINDKIYGESEQKFIKYLNGEILPRQLLHMRKLRVYDKFYEAKIPDDFGLDVSK